jgi:hypothetical protein
MSATARNDERRVGTLLSPPPGIAAVIMRAARP